MSRSHFVPLVAFLIANSAGSLFADYPFTYATFNIPTVSFVVPTVAPGASDGSGIQGYFQDAAGSIHGFGLKYPFNAPYDFPAATPQPPSGATYTWVNGSSQTGDYVGADGLKHGFFGIDGFPNENINFPGAAGGTVATGWNGYFALLCGYYYDASNIPHGFTASVEGPGFQVFYGAPNGTLDDPLGVNGTILVSTSYFNKNYIGGDYFDASHVEHGFVYAPGGLNLTINDPLAVGGSIVTTVSGTPFLNAAFPLVGGYYTDAGGVQHGFLYDGTNYTTVDAPFGVGGGTTITAISGYTTDDGLPVVTIAGDYYPASGGEQAFYASTPEPSTAVLAGIAMGSALLFARRARRARVK